MYGEPRGGSPPILKDNKLYSFFHSSCPYMLRTDVKNVKKIKVYYTGLYSFNLAPPFDINSISTLPLVSADLKQISSIFGPSVCVHFPGGAFFDDNKKQWFVMNGEADSRVCLTVYDDSIINPIMMPCGRAKKIITRRLSRNLLHR
jgi:hypothetical protein